MKILLAMKSVASFLAVMTFLNAAVVSAGNYCAQIHQSSIKVSPPQLFFSGSEDQNLRAQALHKFQNLTEMLGSLSVPELNVDLMENESHLKSSYSAEFKTAKLGLRLANSKIGMDSGFYIHEIGHAIFDHHFHFQIQDRLYTPQSFRLESEQKIQDFLNEVYAQEKYKTFVRQLDQLNSQRSALHDKNDIAGIQKINFQVAELKAEINDFFHTDETNQQFRNEQRRLQDFLLPYNEMFADLASSLFHKDGGIMAKSLGIPETSPFLTYWEKESESPMYRTENSGVSRPRDFTSVVSFKKWKHEGTAVDIYTLFDPTRAAVWKTNHGKLKDNVTAEDTLKCFLLAAQSHVEFRLKRGDLLNSKNEPSLLNQEFFGFFIKAAKKMDLWRSYP